MIKFFFALIFEFAILKIFKLVFSDKMWKFMCRGCGGLLRIEIKDGMFF